MHLTCPLCHADLPNLDNVYPFDEVDHVTVETVERVRFMNNAVAQRAVAGRLSKAELIRWLLDENERLQRRLHQAAAMAPGIFPRR